jgi:hypothetical protein
VVVNAPHSFFSTCPSCKQLRLQNGYERIELIESLDGDRAIDAYCLTCDVVWSIGEQERDLLTDAILAGEQHTPPPGGD